MAYNVQSSSCQLPFCASPIFNFEIGEFTCYNKNCTPVARLGGLAPARPIILTDYNTIALKVTTQ